MREKVSNNFVPRHASLQYPSNLNRVALDPSMTSYLSDPSLQIPPTCPPVNTHAFSPMLSNAEYVYLKDIRVPCSETSKDETIVPKPFSPALMSTHNPTPANLPWYKYHAHRIVPGGHYHLSPRSSYVASPTQYALAPNSNFCPNQFKRNLSDKLCVSTPVSKPPSRIQVDDAMNIAQLSNPEDNCCEKIEDENLTQRNCNFHNTTQQSSASIPNLRTVSNGQDEAWHNNNNSNVSMASLFLRGFRSHSASLPMLAHRKPSVRQGKQEDREKRSASADDLIKNDNDSDYRRSFTSGSASTVRCMMSRENMNVGSSAGGEERQCVWNLSELDSRIAPIF